MALGCAALGVWASCSVGCGVGQTLNATVLSVSPDDLAGWRDEQRILCRFRSADLTAAGGSQAGLPSLGAVAHWAVSPPCGLVLGLGAPD